MTSTQSRLSYALVTPARNEEGLIEATIRSVLAQSVRPVRWVIVSDGSTDRTDDIVRRYQREYDWIELMRMPEHRERSFAGKATAFNAGYEGLRALNFDLIGNLDADITFGPNFYEFLTGRFAHDTTLGVAGAPFIEQGDGANAYAHKAADLDHVSGACQLFRRACFEEIGGYVPIKGGGIDWVAVTTARMKGWKTRTFVELSCLHHRKMGTADRGALRARFRHGQEDYYVGGHPLWQLCRGIFQMRNRPFVLGGAFLLAGYYWAMLRRVPRRVSPALAAFHRSEQLARLRGMLRR